MSARKQSSTRFSKRWTRTVVVVSWAAAGPVFGYSDTWQLVIITFLMVFLIQNTQTKLDELIRVGEGSNAFIGIEYLTQQEVDEFRARCEAAAAGARRRAPSAVNLEDLAREAQQAPAIARDGLIA
jgi:low affinity Fe/Cu permease